MSHSALIEDAEAFTARLVLVTGRAKDRAAKMEAFTAELWRALSLRGVSWVGFYLEDPGAPEESRLLLGPRRDRPACSPIGLHGVCGKAFLRNEAVVVEDVAALGSAYVACDPRDKSELVIPCRDASRRPWGVLDLDSHEVGCFSRGDASVLEVCLVQSGLSC